MTKDDKIRIGARIPSSLNDKLDEMALEMGLNKTSILIIALKTYFDQQDMLKLVNRKEQ